MTMLKAVMWNYGPMSFLILAGTVLYRCIIYLIDLYLAVAK